MINDINNASGINTEFTKTTNNSFNTKNLQEKQMNAEKKILEDASLSNLITQKGTRTLIQKVLADHVDIIGHTLGPRGTYNLILNPFDHFQTAFSSKDGLEGIYKIKYAESTANSIRDLVREIATYMQNAVGDGTTSGYPIINSLFNKIMEIEKTENFNQISSTGIMYILEAIQNYFIENVFDNRFEFVAKFESLSDEVKKDFLMKVATVSANNDRQIAETVVSLFYDKMKKGEECSVYLSMNSGTEDIIDPVGGFELTYGFVDEGFANQQDRMSLIFDECTFLMIRGLVADSDKELITKIIQGVTQGTIGGFTYKDYPVHPLVIIADSFSSNMIAHVLSLKEGIQFSKPSENPDDPRSSEVLKFPVALVSMSCLQGEIEKEKFYDLAVATNSTVIDGVRDKILIKNIDSIEQFRDKVVSKLGYAKRFEATLYGAKIIGGNGKPEEIQARIEYIQQQIDSEHAKASYGLANSPEEELRARQAMLNSKVSRIKIGGINNKEKRRRQTVYDDVIRSIQSSISKEGFTLGGNVNISWLLYTDERRSIVASHIVKKLLEQKKNICPLNEDAKTILTNATMDILKIVGESFQASYRRCLLNAFKSEEIVNKIMEKCLSNSRPMNYNIVTDEFKEFQLDPKECSLLLVPINTDAALMKAIFTTLNDLILNGATLAWTPINLTFVDYLNAMRKK